MYRLFRIYILLTISALAFSNSFAADSTSAPSYTSKHITSLDGLIQNDVKCLVEDSMGYMWIGTNDGLCRYDSHKFHRFAKGDLGLESNLIISLGKDQSDNIWISSIDKGVFCYIRSKCRFYHLSELMESDNDTEHIILHKLCVVPRPQDSSLIDIWGYNINTYTISHFVFDLEEERVIEGKHHNECNDESAFVDIKLVDGYVMCASRGGGIYRYSKELDYFERVYKKQTANKSILNLTNCDSHLFISTYRDIIVIDMKSGVTNSKRLDTQPKAILWSEDQLWIAGVEGTYTLRYKFGDNTFGELQCVERYKSCDPKAIITDHCGAIWIGFFKAGIRRYDNKGELIKSYTGFGNDHISYIHNDSKGRLWIGTDGSGLYLQQSHNLSNTPKHLFDQSRVYAIAESKTNKDIYVSTNRKLFHFDLNNPTESGAKVLLDNSSIYKILPVGDLLYLASYYYGVLKLNLSDGSLEELTTSDGLPSLIVRNMMIDSRGDMWICTSRGLAMIPSGEIQQRRPKIETILQDELGDRYTISITEDHRGDIWCGTLGDGLFRISHDGDGEYDVTRFTTEQSLPNNSIKAILEDNNNAIWVSTNRGLSRLIFGDNKEVLSISGYNVDDGLQDYEFNELAAIKLPSGALLFGGVAGISALTPRELQLDQSKAIPAITNFSVNFKSIFSDDDLNRTIGDELYCPEGLTLRHNQNSISIEFASIHYANPTKNQYQYMLQGADNGWTTGIDGIREVNYSNLSPGTYNFCLRAANSDGIWNDSVLSLPITIRHPFYSDWYAIVIYIILLIAISVYTVFYYKGLLKRRSALSLMHLEKQKAEEMLEIRSRLFTNISHEFRTPLTLISSSIERLDDKYSDQFAGGASKHIQTIRHNGEVLLHLIGEVMNFSKIDSGHSLDVNLAPVDIVSYTTRLFSQFQTWAEQRGIEIEIDTTQSSVAADVDCHLWEQAIYNLVSNAVKHTPNGGRITLRIQEVADSVFIEICDTGAGIEESRRSLVFDRFFSVSSASSKYIGGTGVGLFVTRQIVLLHSGEITFDTNTTLSSSGTTFRITLPKSGAKLQPQPAITPLTPTSAATTQSTRAKSPERGKSNITKLYGSRPTVLLVDDSPEILNLLCDIFNEDYNTIRAKDGRVALAKAEQRIPDIIISDIMMPHMDGYELCNAIKKGERTSHIPVILLSAKSETEDIAKGLQLTADAYCTKPFNNKILFETVSATLINRRRSAIAFGASRSVFDQNGERNIENADEVFLRRVGNYITANIEKPELRAEDICTELGVTQFLLNKKLRALSDMTINAYIRKVRLVRASQLLAEGGKSVSEVTYSVGFSDLRYFRECFKREFGILPTQVKQEGDK